MKKMIRKILGTLLVGLLIFLMVMGLCTVLYQLIFKSFDDVIFASYYTAGISSLVIMFSILFNLFENRSNNDDDILDDITQFIRK